MATVQNIELIDDVRKDALILMKSRPNISYLEAYALARENLIGEKKITEFNFKPFTVSVELDGKVSENTVTNEEIVEDSSATYYHEYAKKEFGNILKISDYTTDQLKAYVIAHKMGVDISKFASELYNPDQINFLAVMLASGKNIDKYLNDYNFVPKDEFLKIDELRES